MASIVDPPPDGNKSQRGAARDKRKYPDSWRCGHGFSMPEHWIEGFWSCPAFRVAEQLAGQLDRRLGGD